MTKDNSPENRPIEELLNAYPDLWVERDHLGFLNVYKRLSPTATRIIGVSILDNIHIQESPEIVVSGWTETREDLIAKKDAKVLSITPQNDPSTYLRIKRSEESKLEMHVVYPQDETKRLDPKDLLEDITHGLEIFDAFSNLANSKENDQFQERVVDRMAGFDVAEYWELIRNMDQSSGENLESFVRDIGMDAGSIKGSPKFALMVMRGIKDFSMTSVKINGQGD